MSRSDRIEHRVACLSLAMIAVALLAGCAADPEIRTRTETVEVEVPVPVHREPPAELVADPDLPRPEFVTPDHPAASSALTSAGETALKALILELLARHRAWRAWATEPAGDDVSLSPALEAELAAAADRAERILERRFAPP